MKKIKVVVLSAHEGAFYWRKTLEAIASDDGIDIETSFSFTDRYYRQAHGRLSRFFLKMKIYFLYPIATSWRLITRWRDCHVLLAITSPFYLPFLCSLFRGNRALVSLHNDSYPEALILGGILRRDSLLERVIRCVCAFGVRRSSLVVYICDAHRRLAESKIAAISNTKVIPVGALALPFRMATPEEIVGKCRILYCGTLGRMHDTETILRFFEWKQLPEGLVFEFYISGAKASAFKAALDNVRLKVKGIDLPVRVNEPLEEGEWIEVMQACQVGVVTQIEGSERVVFPSKAFSVLAAGQAVLLIGNTQSDLARLVTASDCGWVVACGDLEALMGAFKEMKDPVKLHQKRRNAFEMGQNDFSTERLARQWRIEIADVAQAGSRGLPS